MKNNKAKPDKKTQCHPTTAGIIEDMEWFKQFDDKPGIEDACSLAELNNLKEAMLTNIKSEINKLD